MYSIELSQNSYTTEQPDMHYSSNCKTAKTRTEQPHMHYCSNCKSVLPTIELRLKGENYKLVFSYRISDDSKYNFSNMLKIDLYLSGVFW